MSKNTQANNYYKGSYFRMKVGEIIGIKNN